MDLQLTGRSAVVTGASKGIGLAVTRALVDEGAHVVAGARTLSRELDALVHAGGVDFFAVDLSTPDGPAALIEHARASGDIDVLVNNVGAVAPRLDGILGVTDAEWQSSLDLTLLAAVRTIRAAVPALEQAGGGSIVTISSVNAVLPDPLVVDYSAAKAALTNYCKSLSKVVGASGIRVNTISPGPVETALWLGEHGVAQTVSGAGGGTPAQIAAAAAAQAVTGRFTRPEEVADLVLVLSSGRFANITGADFRIDGGLIQTL
ncbi:SDR family oxidoreductase [Microbacterium rhizomatis]|uniref:SDR family oxidoreductase n=1 Tax=Microbacterium rhizomatis TaxID=1631477 RepID=A0A5J5IZB7_9MICO|nr:SDR family oxidoreductase [Microbacterium rhizomatis]KAA9104991.1 SDR family oxidoreductase [Microbacterium rhizomatis]